MSKEEPELTPEEKLQQENNFLKMKLMAENGANFFENGESSLDPEIENQWLNNIYDFEQKYKDAKQIPLYEFIGKPSFYPENELDDERISEELERLFEVMNDNGVSLDFICEYEDRVIYKFITEELFEYEMDDIRMPGMTSNFIYEEFHPNHDHDLREMTSDLINTLLRGETMNYDFALHKEIIIPTEKKIKKEAFIQYIELFRESWNTIEVVNEEITDLWFDVEKEHARTELDLDYKAFSGDSKPSHFHGKATIHFEMEYGYWSIKKVVIPGFNA